MLSASLVSKVGVKAAAVTSGLAAAQKGLTSSGISLAELRQQQQGAQTQPTSSYASQQPGSPRAHPMRQQPGSPMGFMSSPAYTSAAAAAKAAEEEEAELEAKLAEQEAAYRSFCSELDSIDGGSQVGATSSSTGAAKNSENTTYADEDFDEEDGMTWEGIEEILRTMMSASTEEAESPAPPVAESHVYADAPQEQEPVSPSVPVSAPSKPAPSRKPGKPPPYLQPVKQEPQYADDLWDNIPDFVDVVPTTDVKKEPHAPSRAVPSGHRLVKLRPAPTYGPSDGNRGAQTVNSAGSRLPMKREFVKGEPTPAMQEIAERRASKRKQAFLRDATCKAICKIKHGLRQYPDQTDSVFVPDDWSKEFEPLLGDYVEFVKRRPDQFLLTLVEGSEPQQYTVDNVSGDVTVQAPAWNSWKVKSERERRTKSERTKKEDNRYSNGDKTEAEKWAEAEPLGGDRHHPYPRKIAPRGTPWSTLQATKEQPSEQKPPSKDEGDWSKANAWRRKQPLCMEPLTQPLPPMRRVRDLSVPSEPAPPSNTDKDAPMASDVSANAATEEPKEGAADEPEEGGSDDEDCFVVDVIGEENVVRGTFTEVKEEPVDAGDVWSLLKDGDGNDTKKARTVSS